MNKKQYQEPIAKVGYVEISNIIATSTGATGEDVPWASRGRNTSKDFIWGEDE